MGKYASNPDIIDQIKDLSRRLEKLEQENPLDRASVLTPSGAHVSLFEVTKAATGSLTSFANSTVFPTSSPTPVCQGAIRTIYVSWTPTLTTEETVTEVHISTDPNLQAVAGDPSTLVATVEGTSYVIRNLPDGSPLIYGDINGDPITYFIELITRTGSGPGPYGGMVAVQLQQVDHSDMSALLWKTGTATCAAPGAGGGQTTVAVDFTQGGFEDPFLNVPIVLLSVLSGAAETTTLNTWYTSLTTSGFTLNVARSTDVVTSVRWLAIDM